MFGLFSNNSQRQVEEDEDLFGVAPRDMTREQLYDHCVKVAKHCEYTYGDMRGYLAESNVDPAAARYVLRTLKRKYSHRLLYFLLMIICGAVGVACLGLCLKYGFIWETASNSFRNRAVPSPYSVIAALSLFACFSFMARIFSSRVVR